ncbi:LOW QUALITY PROTEIN: hypothetical protein V2J09_009247 [Rumex salicifolius]
MNHVLVAAGVAASHSHAGQWKSAQPFVKHLRRCCRHAVAYCQEVADDRRIKMKLTVVDDSLRQAMYMNCWGQS